MNKTGIQKELLYLGIKPSLKEFEYIATAIEIYEINTKITVLYVLVAKKYNTTATRVERAIRHAKEVMLNENMANIENKFNEKYNMNMSFNEKVTNGDFITLMKFAIDNIF